MHLKIHLFACKFASYVGYSKITIVGAWLVPDSVHSAGTSHLTTVACDYK